MAVNGYHWLKTATAVLETATATLAPVGVLQIMKAAELRVA